MKNSRKCPKCQSTDIVRIPGQVGPSGAGNNVPVGITIFGSVKVSRFLCGGCGFIEEWIEKPYDIEKLKEKYQD